jgi:hypothetical protein
MHGNRATLAMLSAAAWLCGAAPALAQSRDEDRHPPQHQEAVPDSRQNPANPRGEGQSGSSEQLSRSGGVVKPPATGDEGVITPPNPGPQSMPVIPPPGTPGGNQQVQPK